NALGKNRRSNQETALPHRATEGYWRLPTLDCKRTLVPQSRLPPSRIHDVAIPCSLGLRQTECLSAPARVRFRADLSLDARDACSQETRSCSSSLDSPARQSGRLAKYRNPPQSFLSPVGRMRNPRVGPLDHAPASSSPLAIRFGPHQRRARTPF